MWPQREHMLLDSLHQQVQSGGRTYIHQCTQSQVLGHEKCISPEPFHDLCDQLHVRGDIKQVIVSLTTRWRKPTDLLLTWWGLGWYLSSSSSSISWSCRISRLISPLAGLVAGDLDASLAFSLAFCSIFFLHSFHSKKSSELPFMKVGRVSTIHVGSTLGFQRSWGTARAPIDMTFDGFSLILQGVSTLHTCTQQTHTQCHTHTHSFRT